ncbi:MAG: MlaA family lipoprotein, partial [Candidatus Binatia bacterium]
LGKYGVATGPYLMLPFLGPSTIRDTVGLVADSAMNPINYLLSSTEVFLIKTGIAASTAVNYRAMNMELFADVDRYTVDLYGAVQDAYLQQRAKEVQQ